MKIGYGFWFQWVSVTFVGFLVSLYWVEVGEKPDIKAVEGAIGGAVIGLAQWLVLRQRFSQAWWWILISIGTWSLLGGGGLGALGWVAPRTMSIYLRVVYGLVNGLQIGTLIGVAQWLVFRKQSFGAWRWIVASSVGWTIGLTFGWVIGGVLRMLTGIFLGEVVGLVMGWVVVAGITGVALEYLASGVPTENLSH